MDIPIDYSKWKKRFAFLPHKCHVSGKLIWFRFGYTMNTYIFSRLSRIYWRDQQIHIVELLKGNEVPVRYLRPRPPPPPLQPVGKNRNSQMNRKKK